MSYIDGFVIACPKANKDKFIEHAKMGDSVFMELGARLAMLMISSNTSLGTGCFLYPRILRRSLTMTACS